MPIRKLYQSERFLRIIFGASLFAVLCMGGLSYKYIKAHTDSFKMVQHTYEVHLELGNLLSSIKSAETNHRGFLISKDSMFLESFSINRGYIDDKLFTLKDLTSDNPNQQESLQELETKINKRLSLLDESRRIASTNAMETPEFITAFKQGSQLMNSIGFKINEMIAHEKGLLKIRREKSTKSISNAPLVVYYVLILFLTLLLLTYGQISKNLKTLKLKNEQLETFKESTTQTEIISKNGTWIWHIKDNRYEYSDNLYRLLGEAPQSFKATNDNFMAFVHPEDFDKVTEQVDKMMDDEDLPFMYYRIIQKNGTIKHFKAYAKILIDSEGDKRLLGTTSDITDEIENYLLLEEKNLELERNNKELASFNYVASHDLQEPLRKIQTFISRLEEKEYENLSDNGQQYIERIKSASARMRDLIDDLLQYSRTNKSDQVLEVANLNNLLESAKQDLAEIISEKNAVITTEPIPDIKVIPFQIKQLFFNLISNSLKYSRENTVPIIDVSYSKTKANNIPQLKSSKYKLYHTITIEDNGIGFDQSYAENIFVLFNRLHDKSDYSGTGIGLSICEKIVENHNGHIFAEGHLDKGACFTVYLPMV